MRLERGPPLAMMPRTSSLPFRARLRREVLIRGSMRGRGDRPAPPVLLKRDLLRPLHYLLADQAAPLAGWDLRRRLLEARIDYVQVLRLLETFRLEVQGAGDAMRLGAIGFDAVKHLVLCRIERRPPRLNSTLSVCRRPVAMTSAKSY